MYYNSNMFVNMAFWQLILHANPLGVGVRLDQIPHPHGVILLDFEAVLLLNLFLCLNVGFISSSAHVFLQLSMSVQATARLFLKKRAIQSTVCSHKLFTLQCNHMTFDLLQCPKSCTGYVMHFFQI